jgi:hypothetical protein
MATHSVSTPIPKWVHSQMQVDPRASTGFPTFCCLIRVQQGALETVCFSARFSLSTSQTSADSPSVDAVASHIAPTRTNFGPSAEHYVNVVWGTSAEIMQKHVPARGQLVFSTWRAFQPAM